jgi:hypothetical protein
MYPLQFGVLKPWFCNSKQNYKGHFTLWLLNERTKKLWRVKVCLLNLHTRGQETTNNVLQNAYMAALFGSFGSKSSSCGGKFVHNIPENPNPPRANKLSIQNYTNSKNLYILMDFYLSRRICPRST